MAKRGATGGDLVKLWLIVAFVVGCCVFTLANSTPKCGVTSAGLIAAECVGTSMAHGLAPYLPWLIAVMVGLAVLATLRFALRRR
ncbi:hypothetical protein [Leifsonia sp. NPDC077715]|uniref:hypothetical protein n=1 Tax=Leifsonia sp. NPDC077715 TaxID=3155539 RepID=UPI00342A4CC5